MDGYPEEWGYKRRLRIVASAQERQVDRLKHVEEMSMGRANEVIQAAGKAAAEEEKEEETTSTHSYTHSSSSNGSGSSDTNSSSNSASRGRVAATLTWAKDVWNGAWSGSKGVHDEGDSTNVGDGSSIQSTAAAVVSAATPEMTVHLPTVPVEATNAAEHRAPAAAAKQAPMT